MNSRSFKRRVTFAVEDATLEKVRAIAAQRGTTVSAIVREFLTEVAGRADAAITDGEERRARARENLLRLARISSARMGPNAKFSREDIYEP